MVNDPIADLLTRIRNGYMAGLKSVSAPHSEMKYAIAKILEKNNFVSGISMSKDAKGFKQIDIALNTLSKKEVRPTLKRISKPGLRVYVKADEIKSVNSGYGIGLISTPKGVMTTAEAKEAHLGGELLCEVY